MSFLRYSRLLASLLFAAFALVICLGLLWPHGAELIFPRAKSTVENLLTRWESKQVATGGPLMARRSLLKIRYPKEMRENETRVVELTYSVQSVEIGPKPDKSRFSDSDSSVTDKERLDADLKVHFGSSGFKCEPTADAVIPRGTTLPVVLKWTITPEGEGDRALLLHLEESDIEGRHILERVFPGALAAETTINGKPVNSPAGGWIELPISVTNYWGVSRAVASLGAVGAAIASFLIGWPFISIMESRRSVSCTVHLGYLDDRKQYAFIQVVNRSPKKDVEITHVWFATHPRVNVHNPGRPLPRRLKPDEPWETWIEVAKLPNGQRDTCFDKAVVRLSSGKQIRSTRAGGIPPTGHVAGA